MRRVVLEQISESLLQLSRCTRVITRFMPQPWSYGSSLLFPIDEVLGAIRHAAGQSTAGSRSGQVQQNAQQQA